MTKMVKTQRRNRHIKAKDDGLSPVIGEVILIALVLILVPIVTISLMHQLPQDRVPTVHILMHTDSTGVSFYHKGGDYIRIDDMEIFVDDKNIGNYWKPSGKIVFDLGDKITISAQSGNRVSIVVKQAVIFRGVVMYETTK
ncbi:MAG: type IV pilin N-terminal domain-containing protein [Methanomicrobiales archaeon]|jgi:FlaG/FlaF family flagellin (archaellin)|nr:type IV pilin N-terminal domain-containing protein [Methanomicrobiales archaeon]